jgi:hypothetical protein
MVSRISPATAALVTLVGVSAALRFAGARGVVTPWIAPDEALYGLLGRTFWEQGRLGLLGGDVSFYSLVYPLLVGLPLALGDLELGYSLAKALQALVMSATAVPVYLWGRTLMRRRYALTAAALTVSLPGLAYAGLLMTEVAFYPAMALAAWSAARALERSTLARQGLLVAGVALAAATRLQAVVLLPALATAALLMRSTRRLWPTWAALGGLGAAWASVSLARGSGLLGGYQAAADASYDVGTAARFVLYHLGDAVWLTGVIPACALALLALRPSPDRRERTLVAVAASLAVWLAIEVGVFASAHVGRLAERDLLAAAPPLFLALGLWLDRGAPRPRLATGFAALAAAALVAAIPFGAFATNDARPDAFTVFALQEVGGDPALVASLVAAAAAALVAFVPRRAIPVLPALLLAGLAAASVAATVGVAAESRGFRTVLVGPEPRWVDRLADGPAAYLYDGEAHWAAVWQHAFWNRGIERVYGLDGAVVPGPMPQTRVRLDPDGRVVSSDAAPPERNVVASSFIEVVGTRLGEAVQTGTGQRALVLWRVEPPLRVSSRVTGMHANGDVYAAARLTAYGCTEGSFVVTLIAKGDQTVEFVRDDRPVLRRSFRDGETATETVPAAPAAPGGICTFDVDPTGLLGTTRFEFLRG